MREVCRNAPNGAFDYGDPRGVTTFRELLADTAYHPACTAKMGADDVPMAVLDARFRCAASTVSAWPTARRCRSWSR
jgi:hypothetical protein